MLSAVTCRVLLCPAVSCRVLPCPAVRAYQHAASHLFDDSNFCLKAVQRTATPIAASCGPDPAEPVDTYLRSFI